MMQLQHLVPLVVLVSNSLASDSTTFVVRRRGSECNISPLQHHEDRDAHFGPEKQEAACGTDAGSCPLGLCCSASGKCGTSKKHYTGPQCQIDYSGGSCDASQRPEGKSTVDITRDNAGTVAYDKYITACTEPGTVALTFDDGPYQYTEHVLDLLNEHDIKATFFITGNNLGKSPIDDEDTPWPTILRRMHKAGHQLASHTWTHQDLSAVTQEIREQQILYNEMAFRNLFGWFPKYLRPPYGTCSRDSGCLDYVTKLGYHVVKFNIDTKDFQNNKPETIQKSKDIFESGLADTSKGYIELSHDIQEQTAYNLTRFIIKTLQDKGFRAVTVGECLGDSEENWYVNAMGWSSGGGSNNEPDSSNKTSILPSKKGKLKATRSADGTCGERSGGMYDCEGSKYGDCCSYNGWCGGSSGYCDGGCDSDFGKCNQSWKGAPLIMSANGLCGKRFGQDCLASKFGNCCSKRGFCGKTPWYCSDGCQDRYGVCW